MKKLFTCLVALFLATTALWAYDFKEGDLCYNITSDSTVEVTYPSYGGYSMSSVNIPEYVRDYHVTKIGEGAFRSSEVSNITFPNSITSIGRQALDGSKWYRWKSDKSVVYAGRVLYKYKTDYNSSMPENTKIVVKEGTMAIADYAFENRTGLISIYYCPVNV